ALADVDAEGGVAFYAVGGGDDADRFEDAFDRGSEVDARRALDDVGEGGLLVDRLGAGDQGLRWDAAGVEAVAAHLAFLDQGHLRPDGGAYVGGDEAAGTRPDDDEVTVEALRAAPALVDAAALPAAQRELRHEREQAQEDEGADEGRGEYAGGSGQSGELGAGVHIDDGAGEHAGLADQVEGGEAHRGEAHRQVDEEEGEGRDQAEGEEVEGAVALDAAVDGVDAGAEAGLHPVAKHVARGEEGEAGADRRGEGDD